MRSLCGSPSTKERAIKGLLACNTRLLSDMRAILSDDLHKVMTRRAELDGDGRPGMPRSAEGESGSGESYARVGHVISMPFLSAHSSSSDRPCNPAVTGASS